MAINYEYLGRRILDGGVEEDNIRICSFEEYYRLENIDDLTTFVGYLPSSGTLLQRRPAFRIKSCLLERISEPRKDHKVDLVVKYKCSTRFDTVEKDQNNNELTEMTPPWLWRIQDFQIVTESEEDTANIYWPAYSSEPMPFCNSAGVPYDGTVSRGLAHMSFSYNLQYANLNSVWQYVYKINADPVVVADIAFPPRTLLINKIDIKKKNIYHKDETLKWSYYNVAVELMADPRGFDKSYPNMGVHVITASGLSRLWTWGKGKYYGTLGDCIANEIKDGEEVCDPVYLSPSGTSISPFIGGRQIPVYITGTLFEPINFNFLNLPKGI